MARSRAAPAPARSASAAASRPRPASSSPPPPQNRPAATPAYAAQPAAPQHSAPQHSAPPPMHAPPSSAPPPALSSGGGGGMFSGLLGSVVTGAAMGTGSAIAHRAVDSMMGPRQTTVVHQHEGAPPAPEPAPMSMPSAEGPCAGQVKGFADCMSRQNGDMGACQYYFDAMQQCKLNSA